MWSTYKLGQQYKIIPSMHYSSAIWISENMYSINNRLTSRLEFTVLAHTTLSKLSSSQILEASS